MTSRERFLHTIRFEPVDVPFVRAKGGWQETGEKWRKQGWDGTPLHQIFGTDLLLNTGVYYGPVPRFEYEVIEEDETTVTYVNHEGIIMREFKEHRDSSMPQFVKFPVENESDFDKFAEERLQINFDQRTPKNWEDRVTVWNNRTDPLMCFADRWGGFFGPLRNLMGLENLCVAFYDQPALIEKMMEQRADAIIAITEKILEHINFDMFAFWEDMAYNSGSLIDPKLYRKFALKHYKRVCNWLKNSGVEFIFLDSDGNTTELIPIWLEAGINGHWPFEVAAGMDVCSVRSEFGNDLVIIGGIDKRAVAAGGDAMKKEVDRVIPLVEKGGYIPEIDHGIPPDISWQNMCEYMEYLLGRLGR